MHINLAMAVTMAFILGVGDDYDKWLGCERCELIYLLGWLACSRPLLHVQNLDCMGKKRYCLTKNFPNPVKLMSVQSWNPSLKVHHMLTMLRHNLRDRCSLSDMNAIGKANAEENWRSLWMNARGQLGEVPNALIRTEIQSYSMIS